MPRRKEVAKFACGFEAFHTLFHAYLWVAGVPFTASGVTATRTASGVSALVNGLVAVSLGTYAWRGGRS